eukprot:238399-Hanusia_phi.AAC.1
MSSLSQARVPGAGPAPVPGARGPGEFKLSHRRCPTVRRRRFSHGQSHVFSQSESRFPAPGLPAVLPGRPGGPGRQSCRSDSHGCPRSDSAASADTRYRTVCRRAGPGLGIIGSNLEDRPGTVPGRA